MHKSASKNTATFKGVLCISLSPDDREISPDDIMRMFEVENRLIKCIQLWNVKVQFERLSVFIYHNFSKLKKLAISFQKSYWNR